MLQCTKFKVFISVACPDYTKVKWCKPCCGYKESWVHCLGHCYDKNHLGARMYDLVRFLKAIQKAGLYAHLHIGPYACAEWNFGLKESAMEFWMPKRRSLIISSFFLIFAKPNRHSKAFPNNVFLMCCEMDDAIKKYDAIQSCRRGSRAEEENCCTWRIGNNSRHMFNSKS
ncbi:hypothetical protein DVH24_018644 [Malus domestica]|uniref:beta-galactosidase n=1 Tax=Malus domestica TaxID=3750 RepID=A0A498HK48_MALDO|nr:hypothetical protein DVH24_018644 [Malus domestica]